MKLSKMLLIGLLFVFSASAFAQNSTIPFSGMAKITLTDGRVLYGAVAGEYEMQRNRLIDRVYFKFVSEPGFTQFALENKFNTDSVAAVQLGVSPALSASGRSIITAIIPEFGAISILSAGRLRDPEWRESERDITIVGNATGFTMAIQ
jgi:hypothetical protein